MKKAFAILLIITVCTSFSSCFERESVPENADFGEKIDYAAPRETEIQRKDTESLPVSEQPHSVYITDKITAGGEILDIYAVCTPIGMTVYLEDDDAHPYTHIDFPSPLADITQLENTASFNDIDKDGNSDLYISENASGSESYTFLWDTGINQFIYCEGITDLYIK